MSVVTGRGTVADGKLTVLSDENGLAVLTLPLSPISADQYAVIHAEFGNTLSDFSTVVLWATDSTGSSILSHDVGAPASKSLWLNMRETKGWRGNVTELGIALRGQPNSMVMLTKISLASLSLRGEIRAFYFGLSNFGPWEPYSINAVALRTAPVYLPVLISAILFALSVLAYALIYIVFRQAILFDWRVVVGIFLICWICLDLMWQKTLLQRLAYAYENFSGKDNKEKRLSGSDQNLFSLAVDVKQAIRAPGTRLFVISEDDYRGMRTAYYLYPLNVYRKRNDRELLEEKHFVIGDHILLVNPTGIRLDPMQRDLQFPQLDTPVAVEHVFSSAEGSLFRVQ